MYNYVVIQLLNLGSTIALLFIYFYLMFMSMFKNIDVFIFDMCE